MNISGAYAWVKGNHIDNQVSIIGQQQKIKFKIEKAGYSWEYLQFTVSENDEEYMFIVKNSKQVEKSIDEQKQRGKTDNYLTSLADINRNIFKNTEKRRVQQNVQIKLELDSQEEVNAIMEGTQLQVHQPYARFYIVTYEIDDATKFITSIKLTMPNRQTMNLELIEDLTHLIEKSIHQITADDVEPIRNEKGSDSSVFSGDTNSFGYSVPEADSGEETGTGN